MERKKQWQSCMRYNYKDSRKVLLQIETFPHTEAEHMNKETE
ncbi:hypothetical protein QSI_0130 [Clostridioides difficile P28]|nr:hypothetical protein QSI_0130 [Clostridioides difficile P28]